MRLLLVLLTAALLLTGASAATCAGANELECASSYCGNYTYSNNTCQIVAGRNCGLGAVFVNSACLTCNFLNQTACTSTCPDHLYTPIGSSPAQCYACYLIYGAQCIKCTSTICTACSFTSGHVLAADSLSCVIPNCNVANCIQCYNGGNSCYRCGTNYTVNVNYTCSLSSCSVANCITCSGSVCGNCYPGYALSANGLDCAPICHDIYCATCIGPNICGTCMTPYTPDVNGICQIDCTAISVANCVSCKTTTACGRCATGYTAVQGGAFCQATCTVANCWLCPTAAGTCQACMSGWALTNSTTCSQLACGISYCSTCSSISTCSACQAGFTLTNNVCVSSCPTNCLLCSGSTCTLCKENYVLSSGACSLPCSSIANCAACISSSLCASCNSGYILSADYKTCNMDCIVKGCSVCPSLISQDCTTCATGFVRFVDPSTNLGRCSQTCPAGTVNTAGTTCVACRTTITNCNTCRLVSTTTFCDTCLAGYFLNGNVCDLCSTAIANCATCDTAKHCLQCNQGYNNINGACDNGVCATSVANCAFCRSTATSVCFACLPGFALVNNVCTAVNCANSFVFDVASLTCVCPAGTFQSSSTTAAVCLPCNDRCTNCTSSICYSCVQGYFPIGSSCMACVPNCMTCSIASSCSVCMSGFSLDFNGLCVAFGSGEAGALAADGTTVVLCEPGCMACVASSSSTTGSVCTKAADGYSIVAGIVLKCHPNCKSCVSYLTNICTACYLGSVLRSGTCIACGDPNALLCSSLDVNYALVCKDGFTGGAYSTSAAITGGTCQACSAFCRSCLFNGPGNCDSNGCYSGSVQITGTTNCTKCFGGCVRCSASDPNSCIDCGQKRFLSAGACSNCPAGCQTCTSATTCQSCTTGFFLANSLCLALPNFCVSLSTAGVCSKCFGGYAVNSAANSCTPDLACNTGSTCTVCPQGYTLSGGVCSPCTLGSHCVACSTTNSSACVKCHSGFYLDSSNVCQTCSANCVACDKATFCTMASTGYYVILSPEKTYSGVVAQCYSTCATCVDDANFCLSCIAGYTLIGTICRQNFYLAINLVLGPAAANTIFATGEDPNLQAAKTIKHLHRFGEHFYRVVLPASFIRVSTEPWENTIQMNSVAAGSVVVNMNVGAGSNTNAASAQTSLSNAIASNSGTGYSVVSSSVVANGGSTSSGSGSNLGLILGLSIPLGILLILIILILVKTRCSDQDDYDTPDKQKQNFYSNDRMNAQDRT